MNAGQTLANPIRGILCGFDESGEPLVDFPTNSTGRPVSAISTVSLEITDTDREVILLFEDGDASRPIVVGVRQSPSGRKAGAVSVGQERLEYTAKSEIVLRCGKASIQLLSDGSVRIRGSNVLSRASATNRIRGGNVQIN